MISKVIDPDSSVSLFVRNILIFQEHAVGDQMTVLPFYADGYPGLMFHNTPQGMWVQPQNKKMPVAYLYGQTIHPIEICLKGCYDIVVFQLYPFVLNGFFDVDSRMLNDNCYDMQQLEAWKPYEVDLISEPDTAKQTRIIQRYLLSVFNDRRQHLDMAVRKGIKLILDRKAQISVKEVCEQVHLTIRTFERRFIKEVGVSARDFIQITKFQQSLEQLTHKRYNKLNDIVFSNGFADQSHFIRVFKAFTGKTPKRFDQA